MIGVPLPHPRDSIIANLNQQLDQYFGAGKTVIEAAKEMGMETKRARLIARQNNIKFSGPQRHASATKCASTTGSTDFFGN
jgi:hypothetical protein